MFQPPPLPAKSPSYQMEPHVVTDGAEDSLRALADEIGQDQQPNKELTKEELAMLPPVSCV